MLNLLMKALCRFPAARSALLEVMARERTEELLKAACAERALTEGMDYLLPAVAEFLHRRPLAEPQLALLAYAANASLHYGQEGEDIVLARFLGEQSPGFFVDVGACHPTRFSNTYALYRLGWRGLNLDATPGSMEPFRQWRPRDINLEAAIAETTEPMTFHMFREPALNTFDCALAEGYARTGFEILETRLVAPRPLAAVLDERLPAGQTVDLLTIDVEGGEMGALRSNDWDKCRPGHIVLEVLDWPLADLPAAPAVAYLRERGYEPVAKLIQSVILRKL